ncbi:MAG: helix-turn-helix domain-containing protein [Alphaproteobacteria bacterium]
MPSARAPDLRRIRTTRTYDVSEIADLFGIHTNTVHNWVKAGLVVIPDTKPVLIYGECLKSFLKNLRLERKQTCAANQMYCCKCKCPRMAKPQSVAIHGQTQTSLTLTGICDVCGVSMYRGGSVKKLDEYQNAFGEFKKGKPDI